MIILAECYPLVPDDLHCQDWKEFYTIWVSTAKEIYKLKKYHRIYSLFSAFACPKESKRFVVEPTVLVKEQLPDVSAVRQKRPPPMMLQFYLKLNGLSLNLVWHANTFQLSLISFHEWFAESFVRHTDQQGHVIGRHQDQLVRCTNFYEIVIGETKFHSMAIFLQGKKAE